MKSYDSNIFYLNIGGSNRFIRKNWRILDYKQKYLDYNLNLFISPTLPIKNHSVDLIITSHCIEHIGDKPTAHLLKECYRILKPGGVMRIVVPDIDLAYDAFRDNNLVWFQSINKNSKEWSIEKHFANFFSVYWIDKDSDMRKDISNMSKIDFLEKYHIEPDGEWFESGHITWFNKDKIKEMAESVGFKVVFSKYLGSISEEMRDPMFDTYPIFSFWTDLVKK